MWAFVAASMSCTLTRMRSASPITLPSTIVPGRIALMMLSTVTSALRYGLTPFREITSSP